MDKYVIKTSWPKLVEFLLNLGYPLQWMPFVEVVEEEDV